MKSPHGHLSMTDYITASNSEMTSYVRKMQIKTRITHSHTYIEMLFWYIIFIGITLWQNVSSHNIQFDVIWWELCIATKFLKQYLKLQCTHSGVTLKTIYRIFSTHHSPQSIHLSLQKSIYLITSIFHCQTLVSSCIENIREVESR
jgi:hypothetical protein